MSTDRLLPVLHSRSNQQNLIIKNPQKIQSSRYQSNIDKVNKNLMKAKLKLKKYQQNYKSTQVQSLNRIEKIIQKNRQLQLNIDSSNKNNAFALKYSNNRFKFIGNQYLKHSLKKIDPVHAEKSLLKASKTQSQQPYLQVNASYLKPIQNPYKSSLANSWYKQFNNFQQFQWNFLIKLISIAFITFCQIQKTKIKHLNVLRIVELIHMSKFISLISLNKQLRNNNK